MDSKEYHKILDELGVNCSNLNLFNKIAEYHYDKGRTSVLDSIDRLNKELYLHKRSVKDILNG